ncbi:NAD(P)-dependent oxidoreductase [Nocardia miyunensis]|uniref:NAD(P)-dependent oxidoreductase n=1 Tax=Nocardia miyunensis TaxID=282684 RepID=UPI00082F54B1|nr:NAD(P)-binding domain-containing protein [Nocardia miyunensis]
MDNRISVFGTGLMGSAFVRALLRSGFEVTVWNRTPERCAPLVSEGAILAQSPVAAAQATDTLLFLVLDQDAVEELLSGIDVSGRRVINYVTGAPADGPRIAELVTKAGGQYLDAAIAAYPDDIGQEGALIYYAGSRSAWNQVQDVRAALSGLSPYVDENPGAANVMDAAWVACFHCVALGGFHEAMSFALGQGVSIETIAGGVDHFLGLLRDIMFEAVETIKSGDFSTDQATLDVYLAGTSTMLKAMVDSGERASLMAANVANLETASKAGHGPQSLFAQLLTMRA